MSDHENERDTRIIAPGKAPVEWDVDRNLPVYVEDLLYIADRWIPAGAECSLGEYIRTMASADYRRDEGERPEWWFHFCSTYGYEIRLIVDECHACGINRRDRWVNIENPRGQFEAAFGIHLEDWQWDYVEHLRKGERLVPKGQHGAKWISDSRVERPQARTDSDN